VEPVTVPSEKSEPKKAMIVAIWLFLGGIIGVGIVFGKDYLKEIKQKWTETKWQIVISIVSCRFFVVSLKNALIIILLTYNIFDEFNNFYCQLFTSMKSYKDLEIYKESFDLAVCIYLLSMKLPHPDRFETGSQIRRSSQTIKDTIVEGYGRRRYKTDF
jgi:hypothetical protein